MNFDTSRSFAKIASGIGASAIGGAPAEMRQREANIANALLRARQQISNAERGAETIESQGDNAVAAYDQAGTNSLFGSLINGVVQGVSQGMAAQAKAPVDPLKGTTGVGPFADGDLYGRFLNNW